MKKLLLGLCGVAAFASVTFAGVEYGGKEMKQVAGPPPCPEWYADQEFNVSLWGTYIFTANNWQDDRYMLSDHAWGGGIDAKYFFHRYFGVGVEGWMVDSRQARENIFVDFSDGIFQDTFHNVGGGGIFGGGQRPINVLFRENAAGFPVTGPGGLISNGGEGFDIVKTVGHTESESEGIGQVGAGLEVRFTPHIGWVSDFSWNFINGPDNNFGMVRTGVNFAF